MSGAVGRGTVLAGRYRVVQPVASDLVGASTWQATDQILDRPVRVRVLESGAIAPALDAARRAALVTDPRLVRVLDVGTHDGVGYVVTEQVDGPSLSQLVARGPLDADQARAVVGEAASALEVARRRGVHHLALRPSAVHVSPGGRVLVSGLALDAALLGTASGDARTTSRADTVGLVRLLYTALTGSWPVDPRAPWHADAPPQAPVFDGVPVAPADLVPSVPADLDTLCAVTLGPHEDGPHSPGELVRELEPWGVIRADLAVGGPVAGSAPAGSAPAGSAPAGSAPAGSAPAGPVAAADGVDHDSQDTAPIRVPRQSARTTFDERNTPGANRPGTPPPASPTRTSAFGAPTPAVGPADPVPPPPPVRSTPTSRPVPPVQPAQPAQPVQSAPPARPAVPTRPDPALFTTSGVPSPDRSVPGSARSVPGSSGPVPEFDGFLVEDVPARNRRRFDPTALVLGIVAVLVVVGVIFAFRALFSSFEPRTPGPDDAAVPPVTATSSAPTPSAQDPSPPAPEQPAGGPPVIATAITVDPSDDDGEHEEDAQKAFDGDESTFWYTQTYKRDDFAGFKDGVGFAMTLTTNTTVHTVTLTSNSTGGHVEVRATDATAPTSGPVLASGAFGPETVLTLDPATQTQSITLWITQLPTAPDGGFRLELREIRLS